MPDYQDPGWRPALRAALPLILIPFWIGLLARRKGLDGLTRLRTLFVRLAAVPFLFFIPLYIITDDAPGPIHPGWLPWSVVGLGLVDLMGVIWVRNRRLDASSQRRLAGSYVGAFFIGVGLAQSAQLFGFVGVFIGSKFWIYPLGMAFGVVGLALLTPTEGDIRRRQEQIAAQGSSLSLGVALTAWESGASTQ